MKKTIVLCMSLVLILTAFTGPVLSETTYLGDNIEEIIKQEEKDWICCFEEGTTKFFHWHRDKCEAAPGHHVFSKETCGCIGEFACCLTPDKKIINIPRSICLLEVKGEVLENCENNKVCCLYNGRFFKERRHTCLSDYGGKVINSCICEDEKVTASTPPPNPTPKCCFTHNQEYKKLTEAECESSTWGGKIVSDSFCKVKEPTITTPPVANPICCLTIDNEYIVTSRSRCSEEHSGIQVQYEHCLGTTTSTTTDIEPIPEPEINAEDILDSTEILPDPELPLDDDFLGEEIPGSTDSINDITIEDTIDAFEDLGICCQALDGSYMYLMRSECLNTHGGIEVPIHLCTPE